MWTFEQILSGAEFLFRVSVKNPLLYMNFVLLTLVYFLWKDNQFYKEQNRLQGMEMVKIKDWAIEKFDHLNEVIFKLKDDALKASEERARSDRQLYENYMTIKRIKE